MEECEPIQGGDVAKLLIVIPVGGSADRKDLFFHEIYDMQVVVVFAIVAYRNIDILIQHDFSVHSVILGPNLHLDIAGGAVPGTKPGQQPFHGQRRSAAHDEADLLLFPSEGRNLGLDIVKRAIDDTEQLLARGGETNRATDADEQFGTEAAFKIPDSLADCSLRDVKLGGGYTETFPTRYDREEPQAANQRGVKTAKDVGSVSLSGGLQHLSLVLLLELLWSDPNSMQRVALQKLLCDKLPFRFRLEATILNYLLTSAFFS